MCDYSLQTVKSRPAQVGDKLITKNWGTGTTGFADVSDESVAVCVLPGTEIAFDKPVKSGNDFRGYKSHGKLARFRQQDKEHPRVHHDALEFADGKIERLTDLFIGLRATVLQLPAAPKTEEEAAEQKRVEYAG